MIGWRGLGDPWTGVSWRCEEDQGRVHEETEVANDGPESSSDEKRGP
jgi:hypothetical protein